MNEEQYFQKMFIDHLNNGRYYELLSKKKVRTDITYDSLWLQHLKMYDVFYGQIDSMIVNPQRDYRLHEIHPKTIQKKVFRHSLNGLDYIKVLHSKNPYRKLLGTLKVEKISVAAADITSNPVANPTVIFDISQRIHPGKNLVSAHQILKMNLNVIINYTKDKKIKIPMLHKTPINTLKEFANKFENIPMIFAEDYHWHTFCIHDRWTTIDANGYTQPSRKFDIDRFLEIVRNTINSNNTFEITNLANKTIEIPNTYDVNELRNLFKTVYKADCFLD